MKYAIKVPFEDGYLYVIDYDAGSDFFLPQLYDRYEDALEAASIWKKSEVVEYNENEHNSDSDTSSETTCKSKI